MQDVCQFVCLFFFFEKVEADYSTNKLLQSNLNSSNTDGSFPMANLNSVLSPYEILPIDQEYYLRKLSYFIMELYVVCTH